MNTLTKLLVTTLIATFSMTSFATAPTAQKKNLQNAMMFMTNAAMP